MGWQASILEKCSSVALIALAKKYVKEKDKAILNLNSFPKEIVKLICRIAVHLYVQQ